ncbi:MAG: hypothetical protein ACRED2_01800 [Methylocella sp.]
MRFPSTPAIATVLSLVTAPASADEGLGKIEQGVPFANKKIGTPRSLIDPDFRAEFLAAGTDDLENPSGNTVRFGFLTDGTLTEPDENTFLVFKANPGGPDKTYDYGRRFLFQGHEISGHLAYITRINLDVPRGNKHRITLLTRSIPQPA